MSDVPTSKWEAKLHGAHFQIHSCGGYSKVFKNTGFRIWMFELLCDKYCAPFDIWRVMLLYTLVWMKHSRMMLYYRAINRCICQSLGFLRRSHFWQRSLP